MRATPKARHDIPIAALAAGRHRRPDLPSGRLHRASLLTASIGSLVSLAALSALGTAVAAGLADPPPAADRPTLTVTYGVDH
jgi:hypothetical protein